MLRKSYYHNSLKKVSAEPLFESSNLEVDVEVTDPLTKKSFGVRKEHVTSVKKLDEKSFVSAESSDLYSIENLSKVGITPVVASSYLKNDLDKVNDMENFAALTLNSLPKNEE